MTVWQTDVAKWRADGPIDHAFANPPWHDARGTASPSPGRRLAKQAEEGLLSAWMAALGAGLRKGGTLSVILPAAWFAQACAALAAADCPQIRLFPLWPRCEVPAKLIILQGVRGGRGAGEVLAGLVMHEADGRYTNAAGKVLRHGERLTTYAGRGERRV